MPTVKVSDVLPLELCGEEGLEIEIPEWAFRPDHWNAAFLRGLRKLAPSWRDARLWEVGVGTGINLIALGPRVMPSAWYISDFDPRCVGLAMRNVACLSTAVCPVPLEGSWDLVTSVHGEGAPCVDVIYGCLPQVPEHNLNLSFGDRRAHYYDPERYPQSRLHACGLGLNEALLQQARSVLSGNGQVVLNLSGRPSHTLLRRMFESCGYRATIIHEEIVPQHAGTSLATLADHEAFGHPAFEFFSDALHCNGVNATEAERRRLAGLPVFHKIYVMVGSPA